jgi:outer membrane protein assembly factor BamB
VCGACNEGEVCNPVTAQCEVVCENGGGLQAGAAWPMEGGCPTRRGQSRYVGPRTNHVKWKAKLLSPWGAPVTIDASGTIYVPGYSDLSAVAPDGTIKWTVFIEAFRAPAIGVDGTVYTSSCTTGDLYALDPATGDVLWTVPNPGVVAGCKSLVVAADGTVLQALDTHVRAVSPLGEILWSYDNHGTFEGAPALANDGTLVLKTEDLLALGSDGKVIWSRSFASSDPWGGSATIGSDGMIYVANAGTLFAFDSAGVQRWNTKLGFPTSTLLDISLGPDGRVYVTNLATGLFALSHTGTIEWSRRPDCTDGAGKALVDANGTLYISIQPSLFALHPDGTALWSFVGGTCSDPALGKDGVLYVACDDTLFAIGE